MNTLPKITSEKHSTGAQTDRINGPLFQPEGDPRTIVKRGSLKTEYEMNEMNKPPHEPFNDPSIPVKNIEIENPPRAEETKEEEEEEEEQVSPFLSSLKPVSPIKYVFSLILIPHLFSPPIRLCSKQLSHQ